jgi:hypothetical protein
VPWTTARTAGPARGCCRSGSSAVTKPSLAGVSHANKTVFVIGRGRTKTPYHADRMLHGAYFGISTGTLFALDGG